MRSRAALLGILCPLGPLEEPEMSPPWGGWWIWEGATWEQNLKDGGTQDISKYSILGTVG